MYVSVLSMYLQNSSRSQATIMDQTVMMFA